MSEIKPDLTALGIYAARYEAMRGQYEEQNTIAEELKKQRDAAEQELINALLDMAERTACDNIVFEMNGFKYAADTKTYFGIPKANRDEAFQLLRDLGHGDLITERVDDRALSNELKQVEDEYHEENPGATEQFPAEYEPLLACMNSYTKAKLSRRRK